MPNKPDANGCPKPHTDSSGRGLSPYRTSLPFHLVIVTDAKRGYSDIDPARVWEEWQEARTEIMQARRGDDASGENG